MRIGLNGWFMDQPGVGSGQYVRHLHAEFRRRRLDVLSFQPRGGDVPVPLRGRGALAKVWYEQVDLPRTARRRVNLLHYPYFAAPLFKRSPVVVTIHDLIPLLFPEYSANRQVRLYNALITLAARRAEAVIAVSEHTRQDIIKHLHIPAERIHVTHEAPAVSFHPLAAGAVAAVKRAYGLDRYILYIGGLNRHKNVQTLLAAFAAARKQITTPTQLVIAGKAHTDNPHVFPDLHPVADHLGLTWADGPAPQPVAVRFLGFVPEEDKPALYAGAALFAYPSLYEGFGFCPLEAMACGTPVVSSRAASLAEIVGEGGILVDPDDGHALTQAMLAVLSDARLAADLSARGLQQARRFSWAQTAEQTMAVYSSVLRAPGA